MTKSMNIALIAPLVAPIAPPFLGGAQVLLHDLAVGLAQRGHKVTLFAATGTQINFAGTNLEVSTVPVEPGELAPADFNAQEGVWSPAAQRAFMRQAELFLEIFLQANRRHFDIIHAHAFDWPVFAYAPLSTTPVVHTVHLPGVDPQITRLLQIAKKETGYSSAVTVSQACAATYGEANLFDRVIYNGVDCADIPFGATPEDFLLFAGRMAPEKGADLALKIVQAAGCKLIMAGGLYDKEFFEQVIAPELRANPQVEYIGQLDRAALYKLMSRARGVLFPSRWEEPFGLVLAESLAAGTPVISWQRGAAPEIVQAGTTGFLLPFEDIKGAAAAVAQLDQLDRKTCRASIESRFSQAKMLDDYEAYYKTVLTRKS